jgi:hypothetical protein
MSLLLLFALVWKQTRQDNRHSTGGYPSFIEIALGTLSGRWSGRNVQLPAVICRILIRSCCRGSIDTTSDRSVTVHAGRILEGISTSHILDTSIRVCNYYCGVDRADAITCGGPQEHGCCGRGGDCDSKERRQIRRREGVAFSDLEHKSKSK